MPRAPLTEAEIERIVTLREKRWTETAIAEEIGCCVGSVSWALLREGVDIHADRPLAPVPIEPLTYRRGGCLVRRYTQADDAQLLALEAAGHTTHRIAIIMGRRFNSVIGRLRTLARRQERELHQQEAA